VSAFKKDTIGGFSNHHAEDRDPISWILGFDHIRRGVSFLKSPPELSFKDEAGIVRKEFVYMAAISDDCKPNLPYHLE
jgi:hypothetical protein